MFVSKLFSWIYCTTFVAGQFVFQPENVTLRNLIIDSNTGDIFVGGVNYIYKLNRNLVQLNQIYTRCLVSDCKSWNEANINQLLMIENLTGTPRLFACGTYRFGHCITYDMQSFLYTVLSETLGAVSNKASYSSVALEDPLNNGIVIASTTSDTDDTTKDYIFYNYDSTSCSGQLKQSQCIGRKSFLKLTGTRPKMYYILATIVGDFRYFFGHNDQDGTFVARLCKNYYGAVGLKTYMEMPLQCVDMDGTNYDRLVAAKVVRSDGELAEKFGSTGDKDDPILIGVFQKSREPSHSAACTYTFKQINESFWKNIKKCFSNNDVVLNKYIIVDGGNPKCTRVSIAVYFSKELLSWTFFCCFVILLICNTFFIYYNSYLI